MNKKTLFWVLIPFIVVVFAISTVYASISTLDQFEKKEGVFEVQDGIEFERPDANQKREIVKSIDPETDQASLMMRNESDGLQRQRVEFTGRYGNVELEMNYVDHDGKLVYLALPDHQPGAVYTLTSIPGSNHAIVEHEGILYEYNPTQNEMNRLLHDHMNEFSLEQAIEQSMEIREDGGDPFIWWGSQAIVNPSAQLMAFYTNRSGKDEIWIKDLMNGDEKPFLQEPLWLIAWINDNEFMGSLANELIRINVTTGEKISYGESPYFDFNDTHLIIQKEFGLLDFINLSDNKQQPYKHERLNEVRAIEAIPGSPWIAVLNFSSFGKWESELFLIHVEDFTTKIVDIPNPKQSLNIQWKDKDHLYLTLWDPNTENEETIIIDINKVMGEFMEL